MDINMNMVREYFYPEVRECANGEWYPHWWGVVSTSEYNSYLSRVYGWVDTFENTGDYDADMDWTGVDALPAPTHMIIVSMLPVNEFEVNVNPNAVHGIILPVVIDGDSIREWGQYNVDECLGGGPRLQDETYEKGRQWVLDYGVSELHTEPVPGI